MNKTNRQIKQQAYNRLTSMIEDIRDKIQVNPESEELKKTLKELKADRHKIFVNPPISENATGRISCLICRRNVSTDFIKHHLRQQHGVRLKETE